MNKKILEELRKKWTEKTDDGFGAFYGMTTGGNPVYDLTRIKKWFKKALQQKDQELIEKIEKVAKQTAIFDDDKFVDKNIIINLIKNQT